MPLDPIAHRLGPYTVVAATAYGPRLLGLSRDGDDGPLATLGDDVVIRLPDSGVYRMRGGHRLWAAPEVPAVTYSPDDHRCEVVAEPGRLVVTAPADRSGLAKRIEVSADGDALVVEHFITNEGDRPMTVAPWAITQLRLGGTALLPAGGSSDGVDPFQADRSLVLWPYTSLSDPRLGWVERGVVITAAAGPRLKLGSGPDPGRLGYLLDGHLFTKAVTAAGDGERGPDRGAVGQVFVDDRFCELESAGPLAELEPGATSSLVEHWELAPCRDLAEAERRVFAREPR